MAGRRFIMDETDWKILAELRKNARLSYMEIGRAVGMTRPAVRERMIRMEENGVIAGYKAEIDPEAAGNPLHVMVSFKFNSDAAFNGKPNDVLIPVLEASPSVIHFWEIYGDLDFLIEAAFASKGEMHEFLDRLRKYGFVRSHLIAMSRDVIVRPAAPSGGNH